MLIDEGGLFLAALVDKGGCGIRKATGVFFWVFNAMSQYRITTDLCKFSSYKQYYPLSFVCYIAGNKVVSQGSIIINSNQWYTLSLNVQVCSYISVWHDSYWTATKILSVL